MEVLEDELLQHQGVLERDPVDLVGGEEADVGHANEKELVGGHLDYGHAT